MEILTHPIAGSTGSKHLELGSKANYWNGAYAKLSVLGVDTALPATIQSWGQCRAYVADPGGNLTEFLEVEIAPGEAFDTGSSARRTPEVFAWCGRCHLLLSFHLSMRRWDHADEMTNEA